MECVSSGIYREATRIGSSGKAARRRRFCHVGILIFGSDESLHFRHVRPQDERLQQAFDEGRDIGLIGEGFFSTFLQQAVVKTFGQFAVLAEHIHGGNGG